MARKRKPSDMVQLKLRFPEALRLRLEREAKKHGASLNSEIIRILDDSFRKSGDIQGRAMSIAHAVVEALGGAIISEIEGAVRRGEQKDEERVRKLEEHAAQFQDEAKKALARHRPGQ